MANQAGRPIAPARKLVALVMGTLAAFVIVYGLGLSSWPVAIFGLVVLALAIALGLVPVARRGGRATVAGTAEIKAISPPPLTSEYGRAEIEAIVVAPGLGTSEALIIDPRVPVAKWPAPGATVPVTVDVDDTRRVRINWKDAPARMDDVDAPLPPPAPGGYPDAGEIDDEVFGPADPAPWESRDQDWPFGDDEPPPPPQPAHRTAQPAGAPVVVRDTPDGTIVEGQLVDADEEPPPLPRRAASRFRSGGPAAAEGGGAPPAPTDQPADATAAATAQTATGAAAAGSGFGSGGAAPSARAASGPAAGRPAGSRPSPRPRGGTATVTVEPETTTGAYAHSPTATAAGMPPAQRTSTESRPPDEPEIDLPLDEPSRSAPSSDPAPDEPVAFPFGAGPTAVPKQPPTEPPTPPPAGPAAAPTTPVPTSPPTAPHAEPTAAATRPAPDDAPMAPEHAEPAAWPTRPAPAEASAAADHADPAAWSGHAAPDDAPMAPEHAEPAAAAHQAAPPRPAPTPASAPPTPSPVAAPPTAPAPDRPFPTAPAPSTAGPAAARDDEIDLPLEADPEPAPESRPEAAAAMAAGVVAPPADDVPPARPEATEGRPQDPIPAAAGSSATTGAEPAAAQSPTTEPALAEPTDTRPTATRSAPTGPTPAEPTPTSPAAGTAAAAAAGAAAAGTAAAGAAAAGAAAAGAAAAGAAVGRAAVPDGPSSPAEQEHRPADRSAAAAGPWDHLGKRTEPDERVGEVITAYPSARPGPAGAIHGVGITVLVTDLDRSIAFYRDLLGFFEIDNGDGNAVLASGDTRLVLRTVPALSAETGRLIYLNLEVGDIDAVYGEIQSKGVRFVHKPRVVNRGDRLELWSATFHDPDGHNIAITQWRAIR